jgi:hypothetical protein
MLGEAILRSTAMSGAMTIALALAFAVRTPVPAIWHEGGGALLGVPPMIMPEGSGCLRFDLPAAFMLQPHLGNRHIAYSWRVLPPIRSGCAD